jgi:plastocyanin
MRALPAVLYTAVVLLSLGLFAPAYADRAPTRQVDVIGNDYAFNPLPKRIKAGTTIFTFANHGKVQHELSLARMKKGVGIDEIIAGVKAGGRPRDYIERSVGILVAGPGLAPDGKVLVDLRKGETYLVFCNFKDTPEAPAHILLGMYSVFRPE